jgi:ATP-dependent Lon protease
MVTALVSALSGVPVRRDVAMTGEITLTGEVLAIGGLKEKTMAAAAGGAKTVLLPAENMRFMTNATNNILVTGSPRFDKNERKKERRLPFSSMFSPFSRRESSASASVSPLVISEPFIIFFSVFVGFL